MNRKIFNRRTVALVLITLATIALASCAGTTRKKKYRFGGCQVTQTVSATQSSPITVA